MPNLPNLAFFLFLPLSLWLTASCTPTNVAIPVEPDIPVAAITSDPTPLQALAPTPPPWNAAEPITEALAQDFPHLARFEGQLLLAAGHHQLVLAGIPTTGSSPWLEGVLAAFRAAPGGWHRLPLSPQIRFRLRPQPTQHLSPIGMTTEISPDLVTLTYILKTNTGRSPQATFAVSGNPKTGIFTFSLAGDHPASQVTLSIHKGPFASQIISDESRRVLGTTLYRDSDIYSVLLNQPAQHKTYPLRDEFTIDARPATTFASLYLGSQNQWQLPYRIEAISQCLSQPQCRSRRQPHAEPPPTAVVATLAQATTPGSHQPLFVKGPDNRFLALAFLNQNSSAEVNLYPEVGYHMELTPQKTTQELTTSIKGQAGSKQDIAIPATPPGVLTISWPDQEATPARVIVQRLDLPYLYTLKSQLQQRQDLALINDDEVIAPQGPLNLNLQQGPYRITLVIPNAMTVCSGTITVSAGSSNQDFACKGQPITTIASDQLSFSHGPTITAPHSQEALTIYAPKTYVIQLPPDPDTQDADGDDLVSAIHTWDNQEGVEAFLYPLGLAQAKQIWQDLRKTSRDKPLKTLMSFRNHHSPKSKISFGCASDGLGFGQLKETIKRLEPDMLQFFGCGSPAVEMALLGIADEIMTQRKRPLLLTPAGIHNRPRLSNALYPAAAITTNRDPAEDPKTSITNAILDGTFTLTQGAQLSFSKLTPEQLTITVTPQPGVTPKTLRVIYSNTEQTVAITTPTNEQPWQTTITPPKGPWLRLEVRGNDSLARSPNEHQILASSHYFRM